MRSLTWLITGCASGIGRALASRVVDEGMNLVATARNPSRLQDLAAQSRNVLTVKMDVANDGDIQQAVQAARARFGGIDVIVNNATGRLHGAVEEVEPSDYRALFETNVFGPLALIRAVLPEMRARGSGVIVNFSSLAGLTAQPGLGHYSATKFALEGLSEALAKECRPLGIHVLTVVPTSVRTEWASGVVEQTRHRLDDYVDTSGKTLSLLAGRAGRQSGDPAKAAAAVVEAVLDDNPPSHLFLGDAGLERVTEKLARLAEETRSWRPIAFDAD